MLPVPPTRPFSQHSSTHLGIEINKVVRIRDLPELPEPSINEPVDAVHQHDWQTPRGLEPQHRIVFHSDTTGCTALLAVRPRLGEPPGPPPRAPKDPSWKQLESLWVGEKEPSSRAEPKGLGFHSSLVAAVNTFGPLPDRFDFKRFPPRIESPLITARSRRLMQDSRPTSKETSVALAYLRACRGTA